MKTLHKLVSIANESKAEQNGKFNFVINALFQIECWKAKGLSNPYNY